MYEPLDRHTESEKPYWVECGTDIASSPFFLVTAEGILTFLVHTPCRKHEQKIYA